MSLCRAQNRLTSGSIDWLPVERGLERSATEVISAGYRPDREAETIVEDDVDRERALADVDGDVAIIGPQVEQRDARVAREAAAVAPVAAGIVAVDVVADRDRVAAGLGHRDANPHRSARTDPEVDLLHRLAARQEGGRIAPVKRDADIAGALGKAVDGDQDRGAAGA